MLSQTILLTAVLGSPACPPTVVAPPGFEPARIEVDVDEGGTLEIFAFNARDSMGALLATPSDEHVQQLPLNIC
jgi:hypothetical protein